MLKSTVVRISCARGPPRGNVCGMRISPPAFSIKCSAGKLPPPALRAGRCGCDSLSSASSRQRVKSLSSSVRLRLVHILLAYPLQKCAPFRYRCIPHASSEGSQESETVPSAIAPETDSPVVSLSGPFMSGLDAPGTSATMGTQSLSSSASCLRCRLQRLLGYADFRRVIRAFRQRAPASPLASSLVRLVAYNPLRHHHQAQVPSAGPTPPNHRRGRLPLFEPLCQRGKDRHPFESPASRPAPAAAIALPPMSFVSVRLRVLRFAPDTQPASHKRHRPT